MYSPWSGSGARRFVPALAGWLMIGAAIGGPAAADRSWEVKGDLLGQPKERFMDSKKSEDVSGIACAPGTGYPRICLLADDETQGAQIVLLSKEGEFIAGDFIRLIYNTHGDDLLELDAEAVAFADGYFYVTGSHGRPRHKDTPEAKAKADARTKAARHVFRVRFDLSAVDDNGRLAGAAEITPSAKLFKFIERDPLLRAAVDIPLEEGGVTIEGLAVRGDQIYFGFRSPLLVDKAAILSLPLAVLFDGQDGEAKLHQVNLKKRGIRDLVGFDGGFLVLAGPAQDPPDPGEIKPGDYQIFSWNGVADGAKELTHPPLAFGNKIKPEALVPLEKRGNKLRALLFFDGPKKGDPRSIEIAVP